MSSYKIISGVSFLAVLFGLLSSFFTVDQTQQALILQFGEPKRLINKPGLNFKIPFIQEVTYFDKRVLSLVSKDSEEVILADQKRLEVDTYSRFKIIDPLLFFQTVRSEFGARQRLESIIDSSVRRVFGKFELTAILSDARTQIVDDISGEVNSTIKKLGMEIVQYSKQTSIFSSTSKRMLLKTKWILNQHKTWNRNCAIFKQTSIFSSTSKRILD